MGKGKKIIVDSDKEHEFKKWREEISRLLLAFYFKSLAGKENRRRLEENLNEVLYDAIERQIFGEKITSQDLRKEFLLDADMTKKENLKETIKKLKEVLVR